jgi:hypothetical protein
VSSYIEEHRDRFGVEPICSILEVSASAYYQRAKGERSARTVALRREGEFESLYVAQGVQLSNLS